MILRRRSAAILLLGLVASIHCKPRSYGDFTIDPSLEKNDGSTDTEGEEKKPNWPTVGLTDVAVLLTYRFSEHSPAYCQTSERLIDSIAGRVNEARGPCRAQKMFAGAPKDITLVIRCNREDHPTGCTETYIGTVWTENDPHSLSDYVLLAQGNARSICSSTGVFPATDSFREDVARPGDDIENLLQLCRPELKP